MNFVAITAIIVSLFFEGSSVSLPLTLLILLFLAVKYKKTWVFPLAFIAGIILDAFSLRTLGITSIFFLTFLFSIFLYERKFETTSVSFILISSFVGSLIFLSLFDNSQVLPKSIVSSLLAILFSKTISTS